MNARIAAGMGIIGLSALAWAGTPATQPAKPMPADQMLSRMLRPPSDAGAPVTNGEQPAAVDKTTGPGAVAPGAPSLTVLREGSIIHNRIARLTRSADGQQQELTFDSDGKTMKDPPVIILPNLKLMAMETAVKGSTRDLRFLVTGVLTEYNGRNYILLEKVVVVSEAAQQF